MDQNERLDTCYVRVCKSLDRRFALKYNHSIGQICCHNEIVFYNESCFLGMKNKSTK